MLLALALACGLAAPAAAAPADAQPEAASPVDALLDAVMRLRDGGRAAEAEPLARRAVEVAEQTFGPDHPHMAIVLAELAGTLHELGRAEEAERLYRRVLGIVEATAQDGSRDVATSLNNLAEALVRLNRLDEAEALHRRALAINERVLPAGEPDIATNLSNLAGVLQRMSRLDEAEALFRRALAIRERALGPDDAGVALTLTNLAVVLQHLNRLDEAESLHRRALAIYEAALPPDHPTIAASLNNLAAVLWGLGRPEAEKLHRRALAIREAILPAGHPDIALSLSNLAVVLQNLRRYDEAEALHRRALAIYEAALPQGHPDIAASLNNLAMALQPQERFEEAAALHRRALAIREAALPADHPLVALSLSNLASVLQNLGSMEEAEAMHRRALAIQERALPENHPDIAQGLENLALFLGAWKSDFAEAAALLDRSARIFAAPENRASVTRRGWRERAFFRNAFGEGRFYDVGQQAVGDLRAGRRGAFVDLQWERSGGAGGAIAAAMARAQAAPDVAALARRRDGLLAEVRRLDDAFLAASSDTAADPAGRAARLAELRATAETARRELAAADAEIAERFPAYAELSQALPLEVDDLVQLLAPDEVLVTVVPFDAQGFFFAYGRDGGRFAPLTDSAGVAEMGRLLRCSAAYGLDPACAAVMASPADAAPAAAVDARGATPLGASAAPSRAVFDLDLAHALYQRLFPEEMRDFLRGRKLIVAPAPELVGLPWHLLVTEPPPAGWNAPGTDRVEAYREAGWLFRRHPSVTVLPTVAALRALRSAAPERDSADRAFLGIGDPVIGRDAAERDAPPMRCATDLHQVALARSAVEAPAAVFAGDRDAAGFALADPARVRALSRLPDTRCELLSVAASLGEDDAALLLGRDASEARIRALDRAGALARYRVLHFATHGLLGGELGLGEPGLVLTPPGQASAEDDGILSAGEIAALTLAADWVVLSACNTAAGSEADAEALSGLARSFFYAGARSLLVSSWPVYSPAAVELTTRAFAAMAADPALDRGGALTLAMRDTLAGATSEFTAHPAYWAPFLLVGEGSR